MGCGYQITTQGPRSIFSFWGGGGGGRIEPLNAWGVNLKLGSLALAFWRGSGAYFPENFESYDL